MIPRMASPRLRGALLLLSGLLFTSAIIRGGIGIGTAQAIPATDAPRLTTTESCTNTPAQMLRELATREEKAITREASLEERAATLALVEAAIQKKIEELSTAESQLSATIAKVDGAAEGDIAKLTEVYEAMKPKEAAMLFASMPADFAAGFLGRMRPENAAAVMTGLPAETAFSISVVMAGRNANAPKH